MFWSRHILRYFISLFIIKFCNVHTFLRPFQGLRGSEWTEGIWAASWENLFMPYANNKGTDQPAYPRSLISAFVVRCLDSIIPLLVIAEILRPQLVSSAERAGWSYLVGPPKTGFLVTRLTLFRTTRKQREQGKKKKKKKKHDFGE